MKNIFKYITLILIASMVSCSENTIDLVSTGTITGRVVQKNGYDPIENAKVTLSPTNNAVFTDADGYFTVKDVTVGDYSVSAAKTGFLTNFQPATVTANQSVNVIFEMEVETALNKAPSTPKLITPEDNAENQETSVKLTWSSNDPENDPLNYRLEVKNDYDNNIVEVDKLTDSTYVLANLRYGTKYFWQVAVNDSINPEVLSAVGTFKTKINPGNRYFYVKKATNDNSVIYSANYNESNGVVENEVKLTDSTQNSWRPRKNVTVGLIAFLRTTNNETHLYTMQQDGSNLTKVTSTIPVASYNLNEVEFAWSANGEKLIYPHYNKLYEINKDGSGLKEIYQTADGNAITECDWSNDGSIIALKTNDVTGYNVSIFTIDMSGNVLTTVLNGVPGAANGLNISLDNKLLLYTYDVSGFQSSDNRQLDTHMFLYNFSNATSTDISTLKNAGTNDLNPRFSPNEAQVIFVNTSNDGISPTNIYRLDINYTVVDNRTLLFKDAVMPDWE